MSTITSITSGYWSEAGTWDNGVPVDGDTVIIATDTHVSFDRDQSAFAGLTSLIINGSLGFDSYPGSPHILKMNGDITGSGRLFIGMRVNWADYSMSWSLISGKTNSYQVYQSFAAIMAVIEDKTIHYVQVDTMDEVETTPGSFYNDIHDPNSILTIHTSDGSNPSTKLIECIWGSPRSAVNHEYRCAIVMNTSGTIDVPFESYTWYPEKEYTTISTDANSGQAVIVLEEDLGLQQGDTIVIGSSDDTCRSMVFFNYVESGKGVYTVQSYVSETKTVTLTSNLLSPRYIGDYVATVSRPIKLSRTSGTDPLFVNMDNVILKGVNSTTQIATGTMAQTGPEYIDWNICSGWDVEHCTFQKTPFWFITNSTVKDCTMLGSWGTMLSNECYDMVFDTCVIIGSIVSYVSRAGIVNCVGQNIDVLADARSGYVTIKDSIFKQYGNILGGKYINCYLESMGSVDPIENPFTELIDCIIKNKDYGLGTGYYKLTNCLFGNELEVWEQFSTRSQHEGIESFDHNQIPGNYKKWLKGGSIGTIPIFTELDENISYIYSFSNFSHYGQPLGDGDVFSLFVDIVNNGSAAKSNVTIRIPIPYQTISPDWWYSIDNGSNWINAHPHYDKESGVLIIPNLPVGEANTYIFNCNGRAHDITTPFTITESNIQNKLILNCKSDTYPVYRDFHILAPANRVMKFNMKLTKDTANILTKIEIIDPANDPLINSSAFALATSTATNNTNTQQLGIAYKSATAKQLILRVSCIAASGNVDIDVTQIEKAMVKRPVII